MLKAVQLKTCKQEHFSIQSKFLEYNSIHRNALSGYKGSPNNFLTRDSCREACQGNWAHFHSTCIN